ncbi:MAG: hypothetical protein K2L00_07270, partial [Muribaculaceae bacterium]|nr:hypothetical protein [Muribaculaceae bacterium]
MRRLPNHDYKSPCTYHITLKKLKEVPEFSVVTGRPESWYVHHSVIGRAIEKSINETSTINPRIKIYRYVVMPDHVHILLRVLEYLDKSVGVDIGKIKTRSLQKVHEKGLNFESLFERDFHDRIIWPRHSLNTVFQYVKTNPSRLLARKFYPEYFRRVNDVFNYRGIQWQAYGNMQLLDNPFKDAVICHRADERIPEKAKANRDNWFYTAENGGVLVSAFIA